MDVGTQTEQTGAVTAAVDAQQGPTALRAEMTRTTGGARTIRVNGEQGTPGTFPLPRKAAIDGRLA